MKKLTILLILILSTFSTFAQSYISEINFVGDEYVELVSKEPLNLSNARVFDDNGPDKENRLNLIKESNSEIYLIVGQNFKSNNNLDDYECNIYESDKSQVSNGGLKSSGEDLTILTQDNQTISYIKDNSYSFEEGESLNYNLEDNTYFISDFSICEIPGIEIVEENTSEEPEINETEEIPNENNDTTEEVPEEGPEEEENGETEGICEFKIISDEIFTDKISFKFDTDEPDYTISYWIEDFLGNIVKEPRDTTNTNSKSFTPENRKEIYNIKAKLISENCKKEDSKSVFYYSQKIEVEENSTEESQNPIPHINILSNESDNHLEFEVYRGDSSKRTVYFKQNSKEIAKFELGKFSKLKGKIGIIPFYGKNNFKIEAFNIESSIQINSEKYAKINEKKHFSLKNLQKLNKTLIFDIESNIENLEGFCYARYIKSPVSEFINISLNNEIQNFTLEINETKLKQKSKNNKNNLEVVCKYKQENLKTYRYKKVKRDYKIEPKVKADYTIKTKIFTEGINLTNETNVSEIVKSKVKIYNSKNEEIKEKSAVPVLTAMSALLSTLLSKW